MAALLGIDLRTWRSLHRAILLGIFVSLSGTCGPLTDEGPGPDDGPADAEVPAADGGLPEDAGPLDAGFAYDAGPLSGATIVLPAGEIPGPLRLDDGDVVEGAGADATCLVGLEKGPCLVVPPGARIELHRLGLCPADGQHGIVVAGKLRADEIAVRGGRTAVRVEGGYARLTRVAASAAESLGSVFGGGVLEIRDSTAIGLTGIGLFAAKGTLAARDVTIDGADYGIMTRPDGRVWVDGLTVRRAVYGGAGLVGGGGLLRGLKVEGQAVLGGLLVNDLLSDLTVVDSSFRDVGSTGVQLIRAQARLERILIQGVRVDADGDLGTGLFVQNGTGAIPLRQIRIDGAEGEGVVSMYGSLKLEGADVRRSGRAGIQAWYQGSIEVAASAVADNVGAGVSAEEGAALTMTGGSILEAGGVAARADCRSASRVTLDGVQVEGSLDGSRCITVR